LGSCKINVHELGHTFDPKARAPTPGAADFCLISDEDIDTLRQHLESEGVKIEVGPVERAGSRRPMISLYFRDPDENLIEVSRYMPCL
jgi:catechol 2,3-dioxygenase-like lactoylglutathione lyase family enzyme